MSFVYLRKKRTTIEIIFGLPWYKMTIMKKNISLILLFLFTIVFSQHSENRFNQESESAFENLTPENRVPQNQEPVVANGPGGPGEPVSIDDYIPLLVLTALGIIIYKTRKNRNLLS